MACKGGLPYKVEFKIGKKAYRGKHAVCITRKKTMGQAVIPKDARKVGDTITFLIPSALISISGRTKGDPKSGKMTIKLGPAVAKWNGKDLPINVIAG